MVAPVDVLIRERNADRAQFGLRPLPRVIVPTLRMPSVVDRGSSGEATART